LEDIGQKNGVLSSRKARRRISNWRKSYSGKARDESAISWALQSKPGGFDAESMAHMPEKAGKACADRSMLVGNTEEDEEPDWMQFERCNRARSKRQAGKVNMRTLTRIAEPWAPVSRCDSVLIANVDNP